MPNSEALEEGEARRSRYGMGVSFDCPMHESCRIRAYFKIPFDGYGAQGGTMRLYDYRGHSLESLTLSPFVRCPCGWAGKVVMGTVSNWMEAN